MRVFDVRIYIPDLWPEPGVLQKGCGNIPKGIADLNDVFVRVAFCQGYRLIDSFQDGLVGCAPRTAR